MKSQESEIWAIRKCNRIVRPLSAQINNYKNYVKNFDTGQPQRDHEVRNHRQKRALEELDPNQNKRQNLRSQSNRLRIYGKKIITKSWRQSVVSVEDPFISRCRAANEDLEFQAQLAIYHAFKQFLLLAYTRPTKLTEKAAFELGRCVVYTSGTVPEDDWYESIAHLRSTVKFVALGHGVGLVILHSSLYHHIIPAMIAHSAEYGAYEISRILYKKWIQNCSNDEFWDDFAVVQSLWKLSSSPTELLVSSITSRLTYTTYNHSRIMSLIDSGSYCPTQPILELLIKAASVLRVHSKKLGSNDSDLRHIHEILLTFFEKGEENASEKQLRRILACVPAGKYQLEYLRVINLHLLYRKDLLFTPIEEQLATDSFLEFLCNTVPKFDRLKNLVDFILKSDPFLASEVSSYYLKTRNYGLEEVTWFDEVQTKVTTSSLKHIKLQVQQKFGTWLVENEDDDPFNLLKTRQLKTTDQPIFTKRSFKGTQSFTISKKIRSLVV